MVNQDENCVSPKIYKCNTAFINHESKSNIKSIKNAINVIKSDKPECNVGMIISPGYLSTTENTSDKLVNELWITHDFCHNDSN